MLLSLFLLAVEAQQQNLGWVYITDDGGPDDMAAQSDMTRMGFNKDNAEYAEVMWTWDDTLYPGKNSGDGCSLWDLNKNGKADFALCVRINTDATTGQVTQTLTQLFDCRDTQQLNCPTDSQPGYVDAANHSHMFPTSNGAGPRLKSFCWIDFMTDPFANYTGRSGQQNTTHDTRAFCRIYYDEMKQGAYPNGVIQPGDPQLINVCSYPSSEPTSNFKDCVVAVDTGFLVINKWTNQVSKCPTYQGYGGACGLEGAEISCTLYNCSGVNLTQWNFTVTRGSVSKTASVKGWGWTPLMGLPAATYSVSEGTLPNGWVQIGFRCTDNQTNPNAVVISSGQTLVCYYVNFEGNLSTFEEIYGNVTNGTFGNLTLDTYVPDRTFAPTPSGAPTASCPPVIGELFANCTDADFASGCSASCLSAARDVEEAFAGMGVGFQDVCVGNYNSFARVFSSATMNALSIRINAQTPLCSNEGPTTSSAFALLSSNTLVIILLSLASFPTDRKSVV